MEDPLEATDAGQPLRRHPDFIEEAPLELARAHPRSRREETHGDHPPMTDYGVGRFGHYGTGRVER